MVKAKEEYYANQKKTMVPPAKPTKTGVKCHDCKGEMVWPEPRTPHPEQPELSRAVCNKCPWKGWI